MPLAEEAPLALAAGVTVARTVALMHAELVDVASPVLEVQTERLPVALGRELRDVSGEPDPLVVGVGTRVKLGLPDAVADSREERLPCAETLQDCVAVVEATLEDDA